MLLVLSQGAEELTVSPDQGFWRLREVQTMLSRTRRLAFTCFRGVEGWPVPMSPYQKIVCVGAGRRIKLLCFGMQMEKRSEGAVSHPPG